MLCVFVKRDASEKYQLLYVFNSTMRFINLKLSFASKNARMLSGWNFVRFLKLINFCYFCGGFGEI
jgi:hypothetical protein